uniref:Uncharacterized protein n=1 Tax=Anguilla anguilla TaxID=7936 RepID=A0A0E9Q1V9_ANGAN
MIIPVTLFIKLMQSSPQAWTHMCPKLQYPYITSRKITYVKFRLCVEIRSFPHQSKVL